MLVGAAHSGIRRSFRAQLFTMRRMSITSGCWKTAIIQTQAIDQDMRFMGLDFYDGMLLAVAGSATDSYLAIFNNKFEQTGWHRLDGVADPHSLLVYNNALLVVSSGTNSVIRFEMSSYGPRNPSTVFSNSSNLPQHFNSLVRHNDKILLSAFGSSARQAREGLARGYIVDIESGCILMSGLYQPHSLCSHNGALYFCDSYSSWIYKSGQRLTMLTGYVRGMYIDGEGTIYAIENPRRNLESAGFQDKEPCRICCISSKPQFTNRHDLPGIGPEVYEIREVSNCSAWLSH
jgi:hypothetical protein